MSKERDSFTDGGIPTLPFYNSSNTKIDEASIGQPGAFPFTRGIHPGGYRDRLWTFRQYSGFGTPEESNQRYRTLLERGSTGLSVAADLPTQIGYDSDDPDVAEEVGRAGVSLDTLADAEVLFAGIPLDRISTSWTVNGTAAIMLAYYVAVGKKQGVPISKLTGTIQNDILKEYVARGTWVWPADPSIRLIADTIEFCAEHVPKYNSISIAGAHFRDAGANAAQEMALTLADATAYVDAVVERGRMTLDQFAPQLSFFFYTHNDFFEEIAKYRAGRRLWARIARERYGAQLDKSCMFRVGCVCGGSTLYAPQAHNNIIRVAYQAMASVLGGVQSMFTAAWDEPFALPSEESATLALRTQQVLAYETGVARTVDPLGGSWYVESLTDAMEQRVSEIMSEIESLGGMVDCIESGHVQRLISDESWRAYQDTRSGERKFVGVNVFQQEETAVDMAVYEVDEQARDRQIAKLAEVRRTRDGSEVVRCLRELEVTAKGTGNLMPVLVEAVEAYCTIGEIVRTLKGVWGEYRQPTVM